QPQTFGCYFTLELLQDASQLRAAGCSDDAETVTGILRGGAGAELSPWNRLVGRRRVGGSANGEREHTAKKNQTAEEPECVSLSIHVRGLAHSMVSFPPGDNRPYLAGRQ